MTVNSSQLNVKTSSAAALAAAAGAPLLQARLLREVPCNNSGALAPAHSMLAKVGDMIDARGVPEKLLDGRSLEKQAGGRVFQADGQPQGDCEGDEPGRNPHLFITITYFSPIDWT